MTPTFKDMEEHTFEIVLAAHACADPPKRRRFVARFRLGWNTQYFVFEDNHEVFQSDNWRTALIQYNYGDVAATLGEAHVAQASAD